MQDLSILIIGAGIAGLSCASLLQRQGVMADVIERERAENVNNAGYMLGLLPLGGRVLNQLDAHDAYFKNSVEMQAYENHREDGSLIRSYPLEYINRKYGSYRGIGRSELINVLRDSMDLSTLQYGETVADLQQQNNAVKVTFSNGLTGIYDLVIAADGIHSSTRKLVLNQHEYAYYDTHWGGWVSWLDSAQQGRFSPIYKEYWGAGSFMGLYPVKNKMGFFLGGPNDEVEKRGLQSFIEQERKNFSSDCSLLHQALDTLANEEKPYYWKLHDCRSTIWEKGNVVLLGDAATGFLPTAGVGASMAMDSASALVDELSRADREHINYALKLYVQRQKQRVERAQEDSRKLGKMMFIKSPLLASVRDYAARFYSMEAMISNISEMIEGK